MKKINISFNSKEIDILKASISKELTCIKCDPFMFSTSVYGIVGIQIENKWLKFTNFVEVLDYFGSNEDVGVFKVSEANSKEIQSYTGETMITIPINAKIIDIEIINENQRLYKSSVQTYDVWVTRGIIIKLDDTREILLEKDVWLSEDIIVERGENLVKKLASTEQFSEAWDGYNEYEAICERKIISLK